MTPNIETFIGCESSYEEAKIVLFGAPFDSTLSLIHIFPLRDLERNIVQGGLRGAWICICLLYTSRCV